MRVFAIKAFVFFLLITSICYIATLLPDYANKGNMLYVLPDKYAKLEDSETRNGRIIFIGGSNLAFGLDTEKISQTIDRPVINMGVHAGMGLKFMIDDIKPRIEQKDIVIIVPEYPHFYEKSPSTFYGQDELLTVIFDVTSHGFKYISATQFVSLIQFIPRYVGNKYFYFITQQFKEKKSSPRQDVVYRKSAFNEHGDIIAHLEMQNETVTPIETNDYPTDERVINYLNDFYEYVQSQDAEVYLIFTPFHETSYNNSIKSINNIKSMIDQKLKIEVIGPPERYKMADSLFFNSIEHLNREGRAIRTQQIIEDLTKIDRLSDSIEDKQHFTNMP